MAETDNNVLDQGLKSMAEDWADKIYMHFCQASSDPTQKLTEEEERMYKELLEWGWFKFAPLNDDQKEFITKTHLATIKYGKLKWAKDHPPKPKLSQWEKVVGKSRR